MGNKTVAPGILPSVALCNRTVPHVLRRRLGELPPPWRGRGGERGGAPEGVTVELELGPGRPTKESTRTPP